MLKVVVSGSTGQICYSLLFRICSGEMFGPDTKINLSLLDTKMSINKLSGLVMEIEDCAFPLLNSISLNTDPKKAMDGANLAILVGAAPRKEGMERSDLLSMNGEIFKTQGQALNEVAAEDIKILVVGNPCNTNALIAMHNAPNIPNDRFYAMTKLDEFRALAQLSLKAECSVNDIKRCIIWGNHSSTQFPDFYNAKIRNKIATDIIDINWLKTDFIKIVQNRGGEIIKKRGGSSAASAANAVLHTVRDLYFDTEKDYAYSVARCSNGEYGIAKNIIFSFPSITKNSKSEVLNDFTHNDFAKRMLKISEKELLDEYEQVKKMKLI